MRNDSSSSTPEKRAYLSVCPPANRGLQYATDAYAIDLPEKVEYTPVTLMEANRGKVFFNARKAHEMEIRRSIWKLLES